MLEKKSARSLENGASHIFDLGMDTRSFAVMFNVSPATVRRWIELGRVKSVLSPGKRYYIPSQEVERIKQQFKNVGVTLNE